jgi:hypothetical protein
VLFGYSSVVTYLGLMENVVCSWIEVYKCSDAHQKHVYVMGVMAYYHVGMLEWSKRQRRSSRPSRATTKDCLVMQRVELRYVAPTSFDIDTAVHTITLPTSNTDSVLPLPTRHFTPPSVAAGRAWRPRIPDKAMRLSATLPQDP